MPGSTEDGAEDQVDLGEIDLSRHDFDGLRTDITNILDVNGAVTQTLKWTVLVPLIGSVLLWTVFAERMSIWFLVPYMLCVIAALIVAAVAIGIFMVLRSRVEATNQAADRVITTVAALHGDYLSVRSGEAQIPMRSLASLLTRQLVIPAITGGSGVAIDAATASTGPIGFVLRPLSDRLVGAVETRVLNALETVDMPETVPDIDGAELAAIGGMVGLPEEIQSWYVALHSYLTRAVAGTGAVAVWSGGTLLTVAAVPLGLLLLLGWVLT